MVLVLIATLITLNVQGARISEQRADEARSRTLAVQSDELVDTNPGHAALAALAAYEMEPTQEARNALLRRYSEVRNVEWSLSGAEGKFEEAAMSADGEVTLVTTDGGRALVFVRTEQGKVRQESLRLRPNVRSPKVSFDGRRISYVRKDDGVVVWHDVTTTAKRLVGRAHSLEMPESAGTGPGDSGERVAQFKVTAFSRDARFLVESGMTPGLLGCSNSRSCPYGYGTWRRGARMCCRKSTPLPHRHGSVPTTTRWSWHQRVDR